MAVKVEHGFLLLTTSVSNQPVCVKGSSITMVIPLPDKTGTKILVNDFTRELEVLETTSQILEAIAVSYQQARGGR